MHIGAGENNADSHRSLDSTDDLLKSVNWTVTSRVFSLILWNGPKASQYPWATWISPLPSSCFDVSGKHIYYRILLQMRECGEGV